MTTSAHHDVTEALIRAADGARPPDTGWLSDFDPGEAAEAVLTEVVGRAALTPGPALPVTVRLDLGSAGRRLRYRLVTGGGGISFEPGEADGAFVTIRQELPELVRAVFGPAGRHDATREVRTLELDGPPGPDDEHPVTGRPALAVAAAHQVLSALDRRRPSLTDLAVRFGSDKWGMHWYTPHYDRYFTPFREERVTLLEIGIGGYRFPDQGGASLRMWKHYFRRGVVHGLDIYDKNGIDEPRLRTHRGDQGDPEHLRALAAGIGPLDIVIDDGSHLNEHVVTSFAALFPLLRPGGLYVVEDVQTAYWPGWGGHDGPQPSTADTSVGLVKTLIDGLHHQERSGGEPPSETDLTVTGVHVHHNLVVIEKGLNTEQSVAAWVPRDVDPRTWLLTD